MLFARLCHVEEITFLEENNAAPENAASLVVNDTTMYLPLAGMIDLDAERERLGKTLTKLAEQLERSRKLLANQNFVTRAKPEVVEQERQKLADLVAREEAITKRLEAMQ